MEYEFKTEIKPDIYYFGRRFDKNIIEFEKNYRMSGFRHVNINTGEELSSSEYDKKVRLSSNIDFDISADKCIVEWGASVETRDWGIKSISSYVKRVYFELSWEVYTDDITEEDKQMLFDLGGTEYRDTITGSMEINTDKEIDGQKWIIQEDIKATNYGDISPAIVDVDFKQLKITIE